MSLYKHCQTLVTVVETGNFSKAAEKLNLSPMAVSKQIKNFEDQLGTALLDRSTRHMKLTSIGAAVYKKCLTAVNLITEIQMVAAISGVEPKGTLCIHCTYPLSRQLLPKLHIFSEQYPKLDLDIRIFNGIPKETHSFDIFYGREIGRFLDFHPYTTPVLLKEARLMLCATPEYLNQFGVPNDIHDLNNHFYLNNVANIYAPFLKTLAKKKIKFAKKLDFFESHAHYQATLAGIGIGCLVSIAAESAIKNNQLVHVLPDYPFAKFNSYYFHYAQEFLQAKGIAFIKFVEEHILSSESTF